MAACKIPLKRWCVQLVTKLRMSDRATGVISWRLRAMLGVFPIDADFETTFTLDLITGSVLKHTEKWDLHRYSTIYPLSSRVPAGSGPFDQMLCSNYLDCSISAHVAIALRPFYVHHPGLQEMHLAAVALCLAECSACGFVARLSLPAKLAFQVTRASWSASQLAQDLSGRAKPSSSQKDEENSQVRDRSSEQS